MWRHKYYGKCAAQENERVKAGAGGTERGELRRRRWQTVRGKGR